MKRTISGVKEYSESKVYKRLLEWEHLIVSNEPDEEVKNTLIDRLHKNPYCAKVDKDEGIKAMIDVVQSNTFKKLSSKTMAHYSNTVSSEKTVKRMVHSVSAATLLAKYCSELGLNEELGMAIALGHDVGHTAFGHEGEKTFKIIAEKYGLGTFAHNIQGALVLKYIENKELPVAVRDGGQCHNGETGEIEVPVNYEKIEEDLDNDLIKSLAVKGYERKQIAGTFEGAAFKLIDKISYVGQDLADAFREGVLNPRNLDPELKQILQEIGISEKKINMLLSQDSEYSIKVVDDTIKQLKQFPVIGIKEGNEQRRLKEAITELEKIKKIDFDDGPKFNDALSKVETKLERLSKSPNLSEVSKDLVAVMSKSLGDLMSQDTSGGQLAREIEDIFLKDFIENSRGSKNPKMSEKNGDLMYDLISYTQEKVLAKIAMGSEKTNLLRKGTEELVKKYACTLLASGVIDEIYPQYANEERNKNKAIGIFDDVETHNQDSKVEGHTRKQYAKQNKEYFRIIEDVIIMASNNEAEISKLPIREKIAMLIGIHYASKNPEKIMMDKLLGKKIINAYEHKFLNTPKKFSKEEALNESKVENGSSLYDALTGRQSDTLIRKTRIVENVKAWLDSKLLDEELAKKHPELLELNANMRKGKALLEAIQILYKEKTEFQDKKYLFNEFKKQYGSLRDKIEDCQKNNMGTEIGLQLLQIRGMKTEWKVQKENVSDVQEVVVRGA